MCCVRQTVVQSTLMMCVLGAAETIVNNLRTTIFEKKNYCQISTHLRQSLIPRVLLQVFHIISFKFLISPQPLAATTAAATSRGCMTASGIMFIGKVLATTLRGVYRDVSGINPLCPRANMESRELIFVGGPKLSRNIHSSLRARALDNRRGETRRRHGPRAL